MNRARMILFICAVFVAASNFHVLAKRGWEPMQAFTSMQSKGPIPRVAIDVPVKKGKKKKNPEIVAFVLNAENRPFALTKDGNILRLSNEGKWEDITKVFADSLGGSTPAKFKYINTRANYIYAIDEDGQIYQWQCE